MPRKIQDIKPNHTSIVKTLHEERVVSKQPEPTLHVQPIRRLPSTPRLAQRKSPVNKSLIILLTVVLIFGGLFWGVTYFQHAQVKVISRHQTFNLSDNQFTASKSPDASVHFEIMSISDTGYKDMVLTHSEEVSLKAEGQVTFYNEFSTATQKLVITTRLADENGRSYTTDAAVTIPGYTLDKNKTIVPGTVTVGIHAFLPGDVYNGEPKEFKIIGFKSTTKYNKIYAKADTPITGGATGLSFMLDPEQKGMLEAYAASSFKTTLLRKMKAQVPDGYILYPDAVSYTYSTKAEGLFPAPQAKVEVSGSVSAVIIKKDDLKKAIIRHFISDATEKEINQIELPELENIKFAFTTPGQGVTKDLQSFPFSLTGTINALWHPDQETLQSKLVGVQKSETAQIFSTDKGIENASVKIFPPWQSHVPYNINKISVQIQ